MKKVIYFIALGFIVQYSYAQSFSPAVYKPALWLDAADSATIVHIGGSVSAWNDKSGKNNHTTQTTSANQPKYISTKEGVKFDGTSDLLLGNNNLLYGPDTTLTLFVVAEPDAGSSKGSVIAKGQWTSGNDYRIELGENGFDICLQGARRWNDSSSDWNIAHKNLVHTYFDKEKEVGYYLNGDMHSLPAQGNQYNPNTAPFSIGGRFNNSNFFKGKIYEVILFQSKLTRCEILQVEGYLFHKWGMQSYIVANHPYKNNPFGICEEIQVNVKENSPNGTIIGSLSGTYVNTPVIFSEWRIESEGNFAGTFKLKSNGELSVLNNVSLDYERISAINLEVSVLANAKRVYGGVRVNISDEADGGTPKTTSELWGINGERWDPRGRLPDFSFVGYRSGEEPYRYENNIVDVTKFGADGSDELSDVAAIKAAIASVNSGIIYFPPGRYIIDNVITITKNKIVLRGAGNNKTSGTRFYFPNSATDLKIGGNVSSGDAGEMIIFSGSNAGQGYNIIENAKMGDRSVTLDNTSGLVVGDFVNLHFAGTHPANGELWYHILGEQGHDWPCTIDWSNGNSGLSMHHVIERIEGNIVTFREPIRLDLNTSWTPRIQLRTNWFIQDCGIENIYMYHKYIPMPDHLTEPGYNSVGFEKTFNCWAKNITIEDADNGIRFTLSGYGEIKNLTMKGRGGHHGFTFSYSSHCLADSIRFDNYSAWFHSFTLTHKANGNVVSNVFGVKGIPVSTDFHRNTPWEALITNVQNDWNYNSSGVWCAGPNAGKRTVYWNMGGNGFTGYPSWDDYQTTLVGNLHIKEQFHPDRGWHENVKDLHPKNLYYDQLNRRLKLPADPKFSSDSFLGDRHHFWERDPSRWEIKEVNGNYEYRLYFSETPSLSGNRPGEYALLDSVFNGNIAFSVDARSLENLSINPSADIAFFMNYKDDMNYYYFRVCSDVSQSGIYKSEKGVSSLIAAVNVKITDNDFHRYSFQRSGDTLNVYVDNLKIANVVDVTFKTGKIGIGSYDDAVAFDNLKLDISSFPTGLEYDSPSDAEKKISIWPNPATNQITIRGNSSEINSVMLFDILGRNLIAQLHVNYINDNQVVINISKLTQGIYLVKTRNSATRIFKK